MEDFEVAFVNSNICGFRDVSGEIKIITGGLILKTIGSIMLVALMMLLTAAMAVNAEENASEAVTGAVAASEEHASEAVTAAAAVAEEKVNESATEAKEKVEEAATEAKEKVEEAATKAEEKVNESATEAKEQPGFEGIFAIAGLLAIASLVLSRRE